MLTFLDVTNIIVVLIPYLEMACHDVCNHQMIQQKLCLSTYLPTYLPTYPPTYLYRERTKISVAR